MRRELVVAFAVVMSVLVATAPVAASHGLAVASIHTSDTDFNAGSLTNMTVNGSGDSATVELDEQASNDTIDDFEDDDLSEYDLSDTGAETETVSSPVQQGSFAARIENVGGQYAGIESTSGLANYPDQGENFSYWVRIDNASRVNAGWAVQSTGTQPDRYQVKIDADANEAVLEKIESGSTSTLDSATPTVNKDEWYRIEMQWGTDGAMTATLSDEAGTTLSTLSATDTTFSSGGVMYEPGGAGGEHVYVDNVFESAPPESGEYVSANHTVENSEQGFVNITEITNATATVTWETNDGSGWSTLNETSGITTAANHTFTWAVESNDTVRVNVTVFNESGNGEPAFTMADEGVQFTANETFVDNSSASPTGDLTTATPTLEIDIEDTDFVLAQGDSVNVTFRTNTTGVVGSDTLTANGTASVEADLSGGDHTWNVTATDDYGHSTTSQDFTITVPSDLTFRNESDGETISVTGEATFIIGDTIVERDISGSTVSLAGLPADEEIVAVLEVDGWSDRTVILDSIFEQSDVFLLNDSVTSTTVTFTVEDRTGTYPTGESDLIIERIINVSGSPEWRRVHAEKTSSAGVVVDMERGERYHVELRSANNDIADLGHVTARAEFDGRTLNLIVTVAGDDLTQFNDYAWNATYEERDSQGDRIRFDYETQLPDSDGADDFRLKIYEHQNESNEIYNQSHGDDVTSLTVFQTVPDDDKTWAVEWSATLDGDDISGKKLVGAGRGSLDPGLCGGDLDQVWCERGAIATILLTLFLFSAFNIGAGMLVVSAESGLFWYLGALPAEVGAGGILLGLTIGALYFAGGGGR